MQKKGRRRPLVAVPTRRGATCPWLAQCCASETDASNTSGSITRCLVVARGCLLVVRARGCGRFFTADISRTRARGNELFVALSAFCADGCKAVRAGAAIVLDLCCGRRRWTSFCCADVDLLCDGNAAPFAPEAASDALPADFAFFARGAPTFCFTNTSGFFGGVQESPNLSGGGAFSLADAMLPRNAGERRVRDCGS